MAFWVNEKCEGKTWLLDPRQLLRVKVFPYVDYLQMNGVFGPQPASRVCAFS